MPASMEAFFSSEVAILTVCGLAALSVLVFLALIVLASFGVIDGKFLLELLRIIRTRDDFFGDVRWPSASAPLFVWPKFFVYRYAEPTILGSLFLSTQSIPQK